MSCALVNSLVDMKGLPPATPPPPSAFASSPTTGGSSGGPSVTVMTAAQRVSKFLEKRGKEITNVTLTGSAEKTTNSGNLTERNFKYGGNSQSQRNQS